MTDWKQKLHIEPLNGWLNDPNGLCYYSGKFHVYFQYSPDSAEGSGRKCWGHMESTDMLTWEYTGIVMEPDIPEDRSGVYSGCAVVDDGKLHIFYTGNVKLPGDYDYINEGREANQIHVVTDDARTLTGKKIILKNADYPDCCSCHVRDPKVWKEDGIWKMVLGARTKDSKGLVLYYEGTDPDSFSFVKTYQVPDFGYMWECPDLFDVDGQRFLGLSPQGLPHEELKNQNVYSSGYFRLNEDRLEEFNEFDHGFDFYAPQTFVAPDGRRILIGWMGIGDIPYSNPTTELGWQHCLTLPRQLSLNDDGALCQNPIDELVNLRASRKLVKAGDSIELEALSEIIIRSSEFKEADFGGFRLIVEDGICSLVFDEDKGWGFGRDIRRAKTGDIKDIRILLDTSSVEIYINGGRVVMSSRFYPDSDIVFKADSDATVYGLSQKPRKLIAIGEALIDFIPDKTGCDFHEVTAFSPKLGGAPANVCGAFAKLSGKSKILTMLGQDPFGDRILKELDEAGIDTSCVLRTDEANTALAFVSLAKDGNRTFSFYRNPSADMLLNEYQIYERMLDDIYALHFCSVSLGDFPMRKAHRKAIDMARARGAIISFDPNLRPALWKSTEAMKEAVSEFVPVADILKISDEELEFITGQTDIDEACKELLAVGVKLIVYTRGKNGAKLITRKTSGEDPGVEVQAVDTTGAGDGFIGALLWYLASSGINKTDLAELTSDMLSEAALFADRYCSVSITRTGAIPSYPTLQEFKNLYYKGGTVT
ncbi:MAG: sucrose-6-phosphate hydrolase [Clostridiales bacterium]|nr:sucrose-6-phosphate hydrolase [Clostridiales bacterium]